MKHLENEKEKKWFEKFLKGEINMVDDKLSTTEWVLIIGKTGVGKAP